MKITPININKIYYAKPLLKSVFFPSFRVKELSSDVFVKTVQAPEIVSDEQERRKALPKYLYHLTNKSCYDKIMQSGRINQSKDIIDGVFMFDMDDFQKNWRNTKNSSKRGSLAQSLIEQALKKEKGLILLRIPTENLDSKKFSIRPEDDVTKYIKSTEFSILTTMYECKGGILSHKDKLPKDLVEGFSPVKSQEYYNQGRPVEYVYRDDIDLNVANIEKVLEIPDMDRRTIWGYGLKHFDELFEKMEKSAQVLP